MAEHWTKHTVQFMLQRDDEMEDEVFLSYQPFISTVFNASKPPPGPSPSQEDPPQGFGTTNDLLQGLKTTNKPHEHSHKYPKVLAFGIMLLEIEMETTLEKLCPSLKKFFDDNNYLHDENGQVLYQNGQPLDEKDQMRVVHARYFAAGTFIKSKDWKRHVRSNTLDPVRQVIEICVTPDTTKLGTDPTQIRQTLSTEVVGELDRLVKGIITESWVNFDPGPINFNPSDVFVGASHASNSAGTPPRYVKRAIVWSHIVRRLIR